MPWYFDCYDVPAFAYAETRCICSRLSWRHSKIAMSKQNGRMQPLSWLPAARGAFSSIFCGPFVHGWPLNNILLTTLLPLLDLSTRCVGLLVPSCVSRVTHLLTRATLSQEGLSCELAGHHYRRVGDVQRAACLFNHARQCYSEWGSNMKMKTIDRQLSKMRSSGLSG